MMNKLNNKCIVRAQCQTLLRENEVGVVKIGVNGDNPVYIEHQPYLHQDNGRNQWVISEITHSRKKYQARGATYDDALSEYYGMYELKQNSACIE